ncbi:MAG: hypothetical protein K0S71_2427 [Clostridia bacterium]|jgi:TRAP-type C4-dicarboxylate transport system permease small subunit|nr:hypothetical protein [Clostridia bacterium]
MTMSKIADGFFKAVMFVCQIFMAAQVLVVAYVFFGRYVFGNTPGWGEPVALMCLVWMCILSSALAVRDDSHLRMSIIDDFLSKKSLLFLDYLTMAVTAVFGIFMIYAGTQLTMLASKNIMPGLYIATSWMTLVVPITGFAYFLAIIDRLRGMKK